MKPTKKKKDAFRSLIWGVATMLTITLYATTRMEEYGFFMLFALICFLHEDIKFELRYPQKNKTNKENHE